MSIRFCTTVFACVWLASVPAFADDEPAQINSNTEAFFKKYDTNHDGFLTRRELKGRRDLLRVFDEADTDHDGKLDLDEYAAAEMAVHRAKAERFAEDSLITARVKAELLKDPDIKSLDVSVETYRGHVLLSGFVEDQEQVHKAERIASGVRGVVSVKNALIVKI
ncbi:MAG TPA: BON domain-containing protein [Burkholderiales bacterium]|nr:BON domain-containing protein [Burkholderiales bacterium]